VVLRVRGSTGSLGKLTLQRDCGVSCTIRRYRNFAPFVRQIGERKAQTCKLVLTGFYVNNVSFAQLVSNVHQPACISGPCSSRQRASQLSNSNRVFRSFIISAHHRGWDPPRCPTQRAFSASTSA